MVRACMLLFTLALTMPFASFAADKKTSTSEKMIGCVDQRDGQYILTADRTLTKVADLEAVGFQQEGFAKFVGNRVAVAGEKKGEGETLVFRVRSIRQLEAGCAPEGQATK